MKKLATLVALAALAAGCTASDNANKATGNGNTAVVVNSNNANAANANAANANNANANNANAANANAANANTKAGGAAHNANANH